MFLIVNCKCIYWKKKNLVSRFLLLLIFLLKVSIYIQNRIIFIIVVVVEKRHRSIKMNFIDWFILLRSFRVHDLTRVFLSSRRSPNFCCSSFSRFCCFWTSSVNAWKTRKNMKWLVSICFKINYLNSLWYGNYLMLTNIFKSKQFNMGAFDLIAHLLYWFDNTLCSCLNGLKNV